MSADQTRGLLLLVATPIGNVGDLAPRAAAALADADVVACEDTRHTGQLLARLGIKAKRLLAVHEHNEANMAASLVERVRAGEVVALVSDAGMPGVSDPGERIVQAMADAGLPVSIIPGASAGVAALVISGMPADRWVFEGFLPRKGAQRSRRLQAVAAETRTTVLYEAPHRVSATLRDLRHACGEDRPVAIVRELTKLHEEVWRGTLGGACDRLGEPRGEHVLVLGGAATPEPASDEEIARALAVELDGGAASGIAVASVSAALGVPKRRVYEIAVDLRTGRNPGG